MPGALHHVIVRGINRGRLFFGKDDYEDFLVRVRSLLPGSDMRCYAWTLMPNHVHLLLRSGGTPVGKVMQRLLTGYAVNFNVRHRRSGRLYQNRFKSILCKSEAYLLELVRYIHLNPLRAGLVRDMRGLAKYPWCGHAALVGWRESDWQEVDEVLGRFGSRFGPARVRCEKFVAEGIEAGRRPDLVGGGLLRSAGGYAEYVKRRGSGERLAGDERILGDGEFVERVLREAKVREEDRSRKRRRWGVDQVIARAAKEAGIEEEEARSNGKRPGQSRARALACYWLVEELGMEEVAVAHELKITQPAVSKAVSRGRGLVASEGIRLERR